MTPRKFFSPDSGFGLMEVMIAMGLMAVVALGMLQIMNTMNSAGHRQSLIAGAQTIQNTFSELFRSDKAWLNTLADPSNSEMECLRTSKDCAAFAVAAKERTFTVRDSANHSFFEGQNANAGFTAGAVACQEFPSPRCPFRVELSWRALCVGDGAAPCFSPDVEVKGRILYNPNKKELETPFNSENYKIFVLKKSLFSEMAATLPTDEVANPPLVVAAQVQVAKKVCDELENNPNALADMQNQLRAAGAPPFMVDALVNYRQTCKLLGQ